jgi:hypothetical protein
MSELDLLKKRARGIGYDRSPWGIGLGANLGAGALPPSVQYAHHLRG